MLEKNYVYHYTSLATRGSVVIVRKPIPYKPPPPKKTLIEKLNIKTIVPFIVIEVFVIILAIILTAAISILFSLNIFISIAIMSIVLLLASYYISIKFFKKTN